MLSTSDTKVVSTRPVRIAHLFQFLVIGLLALVSIGARAAQYDNWVVEENYDGALASNRNPSGSVIGYACSKRNNECVYFFSPNRANCLNEEKYDLLVATTVHSSARKVVCKRLSNGPLEYAFVFDDLASIRRGLTETNGAVSIARGNSDGGISTSRFELAGIRDAIDWVDRGVRSNGNYNSNNSNNSNYSNSNNSYGNNANGAALPEGGYQRTCRAMRMSGDTLLADCQDRSGVYRDTALQRAFNCNFDIENIDGRLTCNRR